MMTLRLTPKVMHYYGEAKEKGCEAHWASALK